MEEELNRIHFRKTVTYDGLGANGYGQVTIRRAYCGERKGRFGDGLPTTDVIAFVTCPDCRLVLMNNRIIPLDITTILPNGVVPAPGAKRRKPRKRKAKP